MRRGMRRRLHPGSNRAPRRAHGPRWGWGPIGESRPHDGITATGEGGGGGGRRGEALLRLIPHGGSRRWSHGAGRGRGRWRRLGRALEGKAARVHVMRRSLGGSGRSAGDSVGEGIRTEKTGGIGRQKGGANGSTVVRLGYSGPHIQRGSGRQGPGGYAPTRCMRQSGPRAAGACVDHAFVKTGSGGGSGTSQCGGMLGVTRGKRHRARKTIPHGRTDGRRGAIPPPSEGSRVTGPRAPVGGGGPHSAAPTPRDP